MSPKINQYSGIGPADPRGQCAHWDAEAADRSTLAPNATRLPPPPLLPPPAAAPAGQLAGPICFPVRYKIYLKFIYKIMWLLNIHKNF